MNEFIVELLTFNQTLNYQSILTCLFIYILIFWGAVSVWVYFDCKKRYRRKIVALSVAFGVFIFSFPALILYLLIRTDAEHLNANQLELEHEAIPSVPIANLTRDGQAKFRIELSLVPYAMIDGEEISENSLKNQDSSSNVKVKLVEYMNQKVNSDSDFNKKFKGVTSKLLSLMKADEKVVEKDQIASKPKQSSKKKKKKKRK